MQNIKQYIDEIANILNGIEKLKSYKRDLAKTITITNLKLEKNFISQKEYDRILTKHLRGKTQKQMIVETDKDIKKLLNNINYYTSLIYKTLFSQQEPQKLIGAVPTKTLAAPEPIKKKLQRTYLSLDNKTGAHLKEINVSKKDVQEFIKRQKIKKPEQIKKKDYTVYESYKIGKIANFFVSDVSNYINNKYPELFNQLNNYLKSANINVLSRTYINIMLFTSFLTLIISFIFLIFLFSGSLLSIILRTFFISIFLAVITFVVFYFYPKSVIQNRRRAIKNELPFAAIHMSAVAGSGAQPLSIFKLLLESGDYKELNKEIKKIINYVNLFGYNLTTALRLVAESTPSEQFKELLNGVISSIETGGNIKTYLKGKADESLNSYRLERKRYVDTVSTYSDIYTGVLIAAPLLFIVTLAIINVIGGAIGNINVETLAKIGTFGMIPFLNIVFLLFINIIQPRG